MKIENQYRGQLEFTLPSQAQPARKRRLEHKPRRRAHAGWWFREMHRVVDEAMGWANQSPTRPEQRSLTLLVGP